MQYITLRERLLFLRESKNLTQSELAKQINISLSSVQKHEAGGGISKRLLKRYIEFYGCDQNWLLTGLGTPYKNDMMEGGPLRTGESVAEYIKVDTPGLGQAVEMLATILGSGNQVFSQAVMLSLRASSDALNIMKQRNQQISDVMLELHEIRKRLAALEKRFETESDLGKEDGVETKTM